jgi:hypothetical protein
MQNNTATGGEIIDIKDRWIVTIIPKGVYILIINDRELICSIFTAKV